MSALDFDRLDAIDERAFRRQKPYPWINPEGALRESAFESLRETLPDVSRFEHVVGRARKFGQAPHDRFALEYAPDLELSAAWRDFVAELRGERYAAFLRRLLDVRAVRLSFHWHYTPNGCSVSPHCDATRKLGSHIFYFNTAEDWKPEWGGETLVLDDGGRFDRRSAPDFDDFDECTASQPIGNRSFLFARNRNAWHGVRPVRCPEGRMRKVFIVVINRVRRGEGLRQLFERHARDAY